MGKAFAILLATLSLVAFLPHVSSNRNFCLDNGPRTACFSNVTDTELACTALNCCWDSNRGTCYAPNNFQSINQGAVPPPPEPTESEIPPYFESQCAIPANQRMACDLNDGTSNSCYAQGCCFDRTSVHVCFKQAPQVLPKPNKCKHSDRAIKIRCQGLVQGENVDQFTCEYVRGCCYDHSLYSTLTCYEASPDIIVPPPESTPYPAIRNMCEISDISDELCSNYQGSVETICQSFGCCMHNKFGYKRCYTKKTGTILSDNPIIVVDQPLPVNPVVTMYQEERCNAVQGIKRPCPSFDGTSDSCYNSPDCCFDPTATPTCYLKQNSIPTINPPVIIPTRTPNYPPIAPQCKIDHRYRKACEYADNTPEICYTLNCCFDPMSTPNCYTPSAVEPVITVTEATKPPLSVFQSIIDYRTAKHPLGFLGISGSRFIRTCNLTSGRLIECGRGIVGITREQCGRFKCCWDENISSTSGFSCYRQQLKFVKFI